METNKYLHFVRYLNNSLRIVSENFKYGVIDYKDLIVIPIRFDEIELRKDGFLDIKLNGKWGIANIDGSFFTEIIYKEKVVFNTEGFAIVQNSDDDSYGVIRNDGKVILPVKYLNINTQIPLFESYSWENAPTYEGLFVASLRKCFSYSDDESGSKKGVYNQEGVLIVPFKYDNIFYSDRYIICERGNYRDLYNMNGESCLLLGGFRKFKIVHNFLSFYFGGWYHYWEDRHEREHISFQQTGGKWILTDRDFCSVLKNIEGQNSCVKGKTFDCDTYVHKKEKSPEYLIPNEFLAEDYTELDDYIRVSLYKYSFYTTYKILNPISRNLSEEFKQIHDTGSRNVFIVELSEKSDCFGIVKGIHRVVPCDYVAFTKPIRGFTYGLKPKENGLYMVELFQLDNLSEAELAFDDIEIKEAYELFWEQILLIRYDWNDGKIIFPYDTRMKESFVKSYCPDKQIIEKEWRDYSDWSKRYWIPDSNYMHVKDEDEVVEKEDDNMYCGDGYEWTDEDSWDAMTDGQYGDYPGSGWDPEMFGY